MKDLKRALQTTAMQLFADDFTHLDLSQQFRTVAFVTRGMIAPNWAKTKAAVDRSGQKQVYYFAIEFLPGRLLASNLLNLGIKADMEAALTAYGVDPALLYEAEAEPALGNGGLGRLGSAFLDAMASVGMPGNGNGIRYRYGLFRQRFVDGYQVELPDDWLRDTNVWEVRKENRAVIVRFGGQVWLRPDATGQLQPEYQGAQEILAVPYDTAIPGYRDGVVNTMRLWSAEPVNDPNHAFTMADKARADEITRILYPDDSQVAGQELRLRQEYFLVSAGVQSVVHHYLRFHQDIMRLPEFVAIHINDTHPAMAVAELMRVLLDDFGLNWEPAWRLTEATLSYTNHTLMQEALESWDQQLFARVVPRLAQLIGEIDRRFRARFTRRYGELLVNRAAPLGNGRVRMANLAVIGSHAVNGVAKLHTQLLGESVLKDLVTLYPRKLLNETNGITMRRWVLLANPGLTQLLDLAVGPAWHRAPLAARGFAAAAQQPGLAKQLQAVKLANKQALADYILATLHETVNPQALFDVQIKRLHAYKRQLLHLLGILADYLTLLDGGDLPPRVHIFAAKAAPSYAYAKSIIKVMNAAAGVINHDPRVSGRLQLIFLPNYNVSLASRIIPAADVSEQISLAGTEASGTSNMKLMANGALTLATLDGANIEIRDAVGATNIETFGLTAAQVRAYQQAGNYSASAVLAESPLLKRVVAMLTDGSIPDIQLEGRQIVDSLVLGNDEYFVLADFAAYQAASRRVEQRYADATGWAQTMAINIAAAGQFAADFTVANYGREIWDVRPTHPPRE
ncbi:glycogen/starch/alpha-glucan family phosphorylase [Lacticaseibacillus nasuensis]|uniref:glycogen/starch/alpha-glucan family phosphorylase n=1 Tax=Lacticaseibacillus nasuensis TaxID=944671 RepID=UPI002245A0A2|nr:glycogen/starch/alpha-glucan family phosphorylase [Lacticaseibacillus nasuensis]MCX2454965.1 glycogen/starch/alpha-glucan family phosphorylase [Lacticaseibacillus nasuensis]